MSEQSESRALAEALLPLYRQAEDDRHDTDGCLCGGECFRESDLRAGATEWADALLASPQFARLIAEAEARGAGRVREAVEGLADGCAQVVALTPIDPWERGWRQAHRKMERDLRAVLGDGGEGQG